ncbi:MAG TPA: peptidoglycan-binding protein, partial [Bacteroides sp.]|nr:peptidoglycan-binding protein [Bacteroides sp.]
MDAINGNNATDSGFLQVSVVAGDTMKPLQDARVSISYSGEPETDIEQLVTDSDGQTDAVELAAPPIEYSMEPGDVQPYAEYSVTVTASGYESFNVSGISLFADTTALQ